MVVWSASRPRSLSSSSTSRNESEYRRYQRTAHRISAGSVCRHLKIVGRIACFTISSGYQPPPAKVIDMSETVKREYQEKLGQDFGTVFYGVWNDWLNGLVRLKEYRALFTDPAAVKLLNAISGGGFMWDIQQILWRDLLLHVTRPTDPVKTGKHENLTVQALPPFCEPPELRAQLEDCVERAVQASQFARDWRNRIISHTDLRLAIDPDAELLAAATLGRVQAGLDAIHAVVATVGSELLEQHIINDVTIHPRAQAFLASAGQLATAVQYVDSVVDPTGTAPITDSSVAKTFLGRVGRPATKENIFQVIELREAAQRLK